MVGRKWRQACAALVAGIVLWSAPDAVASAEMGSALSLVVNERAADVLSDADKQEQAEPLPAPPCPIEGPGGVICTGPEVPDRPPGKEGKDTIVYLPLFARQRG